MEIKAKLQKPYTEEERVNFIVEYNHQLGYDIEETEDEIQALWYTEEELVNQRQTQFNKDFFQTSLGYVRRKVSMATGETKDFLSDLLPTISMGVQLGQPVSIITYKEPDFTTDEIDWVALQEVKTVTAEFVQECFLQLSNDFKPVQVETEEEVNTNETVLPEEPEEQEDDSTTNG